MVDESGSSRKGIRIAEEESERLKRINAAIEVAAAVLVSSESCPDSELLQKPEARGTMESSKWKVGSRERRDGAGVADSPYS
ncbi:hypothetical protein ABZP36_006170 [Zizania latifolia]